MSTPDMGSPNDLAAVAAREHLSNRGWSQAPALNKSVRDDLALIEGVVQAIRDVDFGQQSTGEATAHDVMAALNLLRSVRAQTTQYEALLTYAAERRSPDAD